jgi:hypothetical protein
MNVTLNKELTDRFLEICNKNFRTPELQIQYWICQEGGAPIQAQLPSNKGRRGVHWSEEQRQAQRERIKQQWASGNMSRKKAETVLDGIAKGDFDD